MHLREAPPHIAGISQIKIFRQEEINYANGKTNY